MLILRRKSGESIVIGDNITLTVLDINEGSVRLAIDAPKTIPILRSELLQAADANRDSAAVGESPSPGLFRLLEGKRNAARPVRPRAFRTGAAGRVHAPPSATSGVTPSATSGVTPSATSGVTSSATSDVTPSATSDAAPS